MSRTGVQTEPTARAGHEEPTRGCNVAFRVIPAGTITVPCCFFANFLRRRRLQAEFGAFCPDLAGAEPGTLFALGVEP
jgi:hypothetical protein